MKLLEDKSKNGLTEKKKDEIYYNTSNSAKIQEISEVIRPVYGCLKYGFKIRNSNQLVNYLTDNYLLVKKDQFCILALIMVTFNQEDNINQLLDIIQELHKLADIKNIFH